MIRGVFNYNKKKKAIELLRKGKASIIINFHVIINYTCSHCYYQLKEDN